MENVPVLDLEDPFFAGQIVETFRNIGFVMIKNHGIPEQVIDEAFNKSKELFMMKTEDKKAVGFSFEKNRGYAGAGQEVLD